MKMLSRLDNERNEKKKRGELGEGDSDAVITGLDMEDKWRTEVSCQRVYVLRTIIFSLE